MQVIDAVGEALGAMHPGYRPDILINGLSVAEIVDRIRPDTEFVGISCLFSHEWPLIRQLIAAIAARFPAVPIVLGGEHATAVPELCLADAPALRACALGEGEETVVELLEACVGRPGARRRRRDRLPRRRTGCGARRRAPASATSTTFPPRAGI